MGSGEGMGSGAVTVTYEKARIEDFSQGVHEVQLP